MDVARALLGWYAPRRAAYPWRVDPDPYRILVSEVMLQQTQAARVAPAFGRFVRRFPTVRALAAASRAEVVRAWAGLGYNRRAVALSAAARAIVREHGGRVPSDPEVLRGLPGVGPYTAAAVAAIAFGAGVPAVDTNVRRVVARAALGVDGYAADPGEVRAAAASMMDGAWPAEWNQAVMDLGREVCRPRPRCEVCPIAGTCCFRAVGAPVDPSRKPRSQGRFEGSTRQVRGGVVRVLRLRSEATLATLARETGTSPERVAEAVLALHAEGMVRGGPAALAGRPRGRIRLAE